MPRLSDDLLDCVIYLYPSVAAARAGEQTGGSGFLMHCLSEVQLDGYYMYAVTNDHIIRDAHSPVIRLNTKEGDLDTLDLDESDWIRHPDLDDIAVAPLSGLLPQQHRFRSISTSTFLTQALIDEHEIGIGDDVFLAGRFVNHQGKQSNTPCVRFGHIAMMPGEPIRNSARQLDQKSYLVEAHSISGFSGSPVFVHIPIGSVRPSKSPIAESKTSGPWLLGVDWGHSTMREGVRQKGQEGHLVEEECWVRSDTGMMMVVPVQKLAQMLESGELAEERQQQEGMLAEELAQKAEETAP